MLKKVLEFIRSLFRTKNHILFLGSSDALPPPLSKEEEFNLLTLKEEGDAKAKESLI